MILSIPMVAKLSSVFIVSSRQPINAATSAMTRARLLEFFVTKSFTAWFVFTSTHVFVPNALTQVSVGGARELKF